MSKGLSELNVVLFEARHAATMKQLAELQGARALSAPAMKEVPIENNPAAFSFAEKLFKREIDMLILLTGVGTRALVEALETRYEREKILSEFRRLPIVPRGPKPIRVLREMNVPYVIEVPEPNTWTELVAELDKHAQQYPVRGKRVAVQEYGIKNTELNDALRARGASVIEVPVYRWALPDDLGPLKAGIDELLAGRVDVTMFTTAVQIEHVLTVAGQTGRADALKAALNRSVIASIGPDCSAALRKNGIAVDLEPESPKMGPFVVETALNAKRLLAGKKGARGV